MKLVDNLNEADTIVRKVYIDLLLIDITILSLGYKFCAELVLERKRDPFKGRSPDYHGATSACSNFLLAS